MGCGGSTDAEIISVDPTKINNLALAMNGQSEVKENTGNTATTPRIVEDIAQLKLLRESFIMERTDQLSEHYEMLEEIGRGAYGIVYTAKHKHTGDIRAIKTVRVKDGRSNNETSILRELVLLRRM